MKRRKMSALQKKYFGKRKTKRAVSSIKRKTRVVYMARRRVRSFRRGGGGSRRGGMLGKISPALSGLADNIIDSYSPIDGIGSAIVGFGLKDPWSLNMGMYKIGYSAANMLPIPRGGSSTSGGFN